MSPGRSNRSAFTLIELMLVVVIMVIAVAMGYPAISAMVHRAPLSQSTQDVVAMCTKARRMAILHGESWQMSINVKDGQIQVMKTPADIDPTAATAIAAAAPTQPVYEGEQPKIDTDSSAQISDKVRIDLLDVNFAEYKDADLALVRFSPNGTSDEFTIIMSCDGEQRQVSLEVVTGLAGVESDPLKFGRAK